MSNIHSLQRDSSQSHADEDSAPFRVAESNMGDQQYKMLADSIPALAWMADPEGSIFWYNSRWFEYTGTTPQDMVGWGWTSVHDPRTLPAVLNRWSASIQSGEPFEMVFPLKGADGVFRSFLTRVVPVKDASSKVQRWFGSNTEIDELERTRDVLAMERTRLATVLDNVPVGLVFADATGRITGGNRQAENLFRHPIYLSQSQSDYDQWITFHPDGRRVQPAEFPLARTVADRQVHSGEFLHQCGDGVLRWLVFHCAPILSADGSMIGAVVVSIDIDERKRAQDALVLKTMEAERQNAELETLYRTAPIGLALFGLKDYPYLRLNERQAAFFGLRPDEIVGRTLTEMAPIEGLKELFDQVAAGEPVINYPLEGTLVTDPDNHRYWTVSYFPVFATDGSIQAITAASLEITQQKKAEQALIQSEKLAVLGRLASSIAHEINNPLEAITNLIYLAQHSDGLDEVHRHLAAAELELRRVAAITSQTLRFHKQASSPQAITAVELIESVLSVFQARIVNADVSVEQRDRPASPVRCFEGEIRQVISNLFGNALDALLPSGGCIFLRSRESTHWSTGERGIVITVADTGQGMDTDTLAKLFNPFFTTKGIIGTGLGLWVSKEIIDRHRGSLRVRSSRSSRHRGTVFTVFLPFDAVVR